MVNQGSTKGRNEMNVQLIELIDLEIGKLTAARQALVGSGQQPQTASEQEPITAEALLNGVDVKDFPLFPETNDNQQHRQAQPAVQKQKTGGMSEEGRLRVAAAQRDRWAKINAKKKKERKIA
jgi:hypothetical protein